MDETIVDILDKPIVEALSAATEATLQLVRYEKATGDEIVSDEFMLNQTDYLHVQRLFLDSETYWFGFKRCAHLDVARIRFLPTGLIVLLDFRCSNATFVLDKDRVRAFFDHRREELVLLVNHYFPNETSLSCATVVKKEFLH
jgi:hypothetical protein